MPKLAFITPKVFQAFKYSVYLLLSLNVLLFFRDEWLATDYLFSDGVAWSDIIQGFAATIDTAAWVVLLLMFELETFVLPDERIKGGVKLGLEATRAVCYLVIIYAFYGYIVKCFGLYDFTPAGIMGLCDLAGNSFSFMTDLDEYEAITAGNCATLAATTEFYALLDSGILTDKDTLAAVRRLAWTDVINAGDWLLVVTVLEMDVRLQLKDQLHGRVRTASKAIKALLYTVLLGAAVYWGFAGDFLDFWDALLWILAFVFIELNVFEWHAEIADAAKNQDTGPA